MMPSQKKNFKVKVDHEALKEVHAERKWYRCGLTPDCPTDAATVSHVRFPKYTRIWNRETQSFNDVRGQVIRLTDDELNQVLEGMKTKLIRTTAGYNWGVSDLKKDRHKPSSSDLWLAEFAYIEEPELNEDGVPIPVGYTPEFDQKTEVLIDRSEESTKTARKQQAKKRDYAARVDLSEGTEAAKNL